MSVRPCRSSTLSVVPSALNVSSVGARVGSGGPCSRDGASIATALNLRSACLRRITCRALCNAMDIFFSSRGSFSRRRSKQNLRTSLIVGSCCSRRVFPRFTAPHAKAFFAIAVVSVPQCRNELVRSGVCPQEVGWARPSRSKSFLARCRFSLNTIRAEINTVTNVKLIPKQ